MAQIIDGKALSQQVRNDIKTRVSELKNTKNITPGLATILVGEDPASQVYINSKNKMCVEAGMASFHEHLPADTSEADLLKLIDKLNNDKNVHGILVQLPLPKQINADRVLEAIDPKKDVDGFHPINVGNLVVGKKCLKPCTPYGMIKMLESINYDLSGKHAVVIGRSNIVGKPIALMLLEKNATVTICHSRTPDIASVVRQADVVVAAVGRAQFVKGDWIKKGAVVLDVGINRLESGKLVGDVDYEAASQNASAITPVPGGVGPMTIAMLLYNTVEAAGNTL
ncbi:bifunctional methylenetetrahydrofolate dehydrogenase/methenyltetrahydrofolate cyclohydrolase FolD [bacterium]|nr:bifunctional methylenetetrahydrofolate dehydrogenase/methenyltetrahydrofolate cyclohydrolase FolD [bacterium]